MKYIAAELEQLQQANLYRKLRTMCSAAGPRVNVEGRDMLMMASNNYLGLANDPRLKEAAIKAIEEFGVGSGGSRLTTGTLSLHYECENSLARLKRAPAAILFNTGYMANVGTLSALGQKEDLILSDELNHASIIDGCRLSRAQVKIYRHADMSHLEVLLKQSRQFRRRLIVTDGVFSMDGDIAPLPEIVQLKNKYDALLMVDDAHGTGVLGKNGGGSAEYFGLEEHVDIHLGTLSKALGTEGGFVAGRRELIEYLRNRSRSFIFATAPCPGRTAAAVRALTILNEEPQRRLRLRKNTDMIRKELSNMGLQLVEGVTPIIAVLIGPCDQTLSFARVLEKEGVFAPAIRPPTVPKGTSRIRVTVISEHTPSDITVAVEAFRKAAKEIGLI